MDCFDVPTPADWYVIADTFLRQFPHGGVFLLEGEMGAGKTTFVRAVCEQLGSPGAVSPTFSLINEYISETGVPVIHMDLYRVKNLEEALDFGIEEYLDRKGYLFIEWPDILLPLLPETAHRVKIELANPGRSISF